MNDHAITVVHLHRILPRRFYILSTIIIVATLSLSLAHSDDQLVKKDLVYNTVGTRKSCYRYLLPLKLPQHLKTDIR